ILASGNPPRLAAPATGLHPVDATNACVFDEARRLFGGEETPEAIAKIALSTCRRPFQDLLDSMVRPGGLTEMT
uniref:hypothetical protein n=1 Tax=Escherichia coli TaxID=562 RepID=UPI0013D669F9